MFRQISGLYAFLYQETSLELKIFKGMFLDLLMLTSIQRAYKPTRRSQYSFTPKDDCERQVWNDPTRFSGGAETRYKKYPCKAPCKRKSYETICENIVSRYQTLVFSLPRMAAFCRRRPKIHFMTGPHRQPSKYSP